MTVKSLHPVRRTFGLVLGPLLFFIVMVMPAPNGMSPAGWHVVAVASLMATWWITEAIPIAATALLPVALFPLLNVMSTSATTVAYANHLVFLGWISDCDDHAKMESASAYRITYDKSRGGESFTHHPGLHDCHGVFIDVDQ